MQANQSYHDQVACGVRDLAAAYGHVTKESEMSMSSPSRREFLASITAAGAISLGAPRGLDARTQRRTIGANDRIRIGLIGCGSRGIGTEMASVRDHATAENVEVVAVYDPWRVAMADAASKAKE